MKLAVCAAYSFAENHEITCNRKPAIWQPFRRLTKSKSDPKMCKISNSTTGGLARDSSLAAGSRFVWEGDLEDNCKCVHGDLIAVAEAMGPIRCKDPEERRYWEAQSWWCAVYRKDGGPDLFNQGDVGGMILNGHLARAICEAVMSANAEISHERERGSLAQYVAALEDVCDSDQLARAQSVANTEASNSGHQPTQ